jgi:predicted ferric reductase
MRSSDLSKSGPLFVILLAVIPLIIWLPFSDFSSPPRIWTSLGQAAALVGFCLYATNVLLSSRLKFIETLFFGLNRAYIIHHQIGVFALVFLLFHPLGIAVSYTYASVAAAANLLLWNFDNIPVLLGSIALWSTILFIVLTLYVRLEYDFWKSIHHYLGVALFIAGLHVFLINSTTSISPHLKIYLLTYAALAVTAFFLRWFYPRWFSGKKSWYVKSASKINSDLIELVLTPGLTKPLNFHPGQFIFIEPRVSGIPFQSHPFSLTSAEKSADISLTVKMSGDFTRSLPLLAPGHEILVEGPYGRFGPAFTPGKRQIWIGGGIGITPFVSLTRSLKADNPDDITLYYLVKDKQEAVFSPEFYLVTKSVGNFRYQLHISNTSGRFTAKNLSADHSKLAEYDFFICGPVSLMSALRKQLHDLHIPENKIHTEEFALN